MSPTGKIGDLTRKLRMLPRMSLTLSPSLLTEKTSRLLLPLPT